MKLFRPTVGPAKLGVSVRADRRKKDRHDGQASSPTWR